MMHDSLMGALGSPRSARGGSRIVGCLFLALLLLGLTGSGQAAPGTIAHELLQMEAGAAPVPASAEAVVDAVILEIVKKFGNAPEREKSRAERFFAAVDAVLVANDFIYPPRGQVSLLSESLVLNKLSPQDIALAGQHPANWRRASRMKHTARRAAMFHMIDCDTAAILCLAAAERMNFPCFLVEVPGHSFVRWRSETLTLNWDPNQNEHYPDSHYRSAAALPEVLPDCMPYLKDQTLQQVRGYWMTIVGREYGAKRKHADAARLFEEACRLAPTSLYAAHERAWFLATCADDGIRDGKLAVSLIEPVVNCWPDPNLMDTFAVALAEAGQFERAVEVERAARDKSKTWRRSRYSLDPLPQFDSMISGFERGLTLRQMRAGQAPKPAPAAPSAPAPARPR